jgi:cyclophilin family peptidyl-prolyl cis-trans isomerase
MSFRNQRPEPRRVRRQSTGNQIRVDPSKLDLPIFLRYLTNRTLFAIVGVVMAAALVLGAFAGAFGFTGPSDGGLPAQSGEITDVPQERNGDNAAPVPAPRNAVKRYTAPPPLVIDPNTRYTATIKTSQGDIEIELYPDQAPAAVNVFVFLAKEGYYNGTPFMQVTRNQDGSRFTAQAGDPTRTGLGTPGFDVPREVTTLPFTRGAIGMDSGQFYISYGDYPALNGKYTIFGRVTRGMDVLERLSLLDVSRRDASGGDQVQAIVIHPN